MHRPLTHALPWLFSLLLSVSWVSAQPEPRPLGQLAPAEGFLILGFNSPFGAPETGLQADINALDFPRAGRTLEKLGELSDDPALRDLLGEYGGLFQGLEGQLKRQQKRMGEGNAFTRCLEANTPENLETLAVPEFASAWTSALLSVGASSYSPVPAFTALLRVAPAAEEPFSELQRLVVLCSERVGVEVVRLREGNTPLIVVGNAGDFPVVLSRVGTLFIAGTNPEAVRGVVRRAHGSDEPNLSETDFYRQNREVLAGPGMSLALNAAALGNTVESLGRGFADAQTQPLLDKLVGSLRTLGSYAGVLRFEGQELRLSSRLNVNPRGGDAELAALLLSDTPAPAPTLAPAGSTAVSTNHWQPQRILDYVEGWVELAGQVTGEPISLHDLAQQELGLDLEAALGWLGGEATSIVLEPVGTDVSTLVYGRPQVMALTTTGRAAARAGLAELGRAFIGGLKLQDFADTELFTVLARSTYTYGGIDITRLRVGPTFDLGTAFLGDTLLVGTPAAALEDVITTAQGLLRPLTDDETYKLSQTGAPQGAVSLGYQDLGAELRGYADLTRVIVQPLAFTASAGLSGEVTGDDAQAPDFADLLHLLELVPNTLETFSNHTDTVTGHTWIEGGARRSETRLSLR